MAVKVSLAAEADLKDLISIFMKNQETNLLRGLVFKRGKLGNAEYETGLVHLDLLRQITDFSLPIFGKTRKNGRNIDPSYRVFKARLKNNNRTVGFGSFRYQYGGPSEQPDFTRYPNEMNGELHELCSQKSRSVHRKHLHEQSHIVWEVLCVLPAFQGQGVASELLKWSFEHFGLARETIWIETPVSGRSVFQKYGFEDIDCIALDLSKWAGENRGYGMYHLQQMIRRPGQLELDKIDIKEKSS